MKKFSLEHIKGGDNSLGKKNIISVWRVRGCMEEIKCYIYYVCIE